MSSTINKEEIQKFSKLADEWWDVNGKFKPLHMFNPVRIEYITENIKKQFNIKKEKSNFLDGIRILDIVQHLELVSCSSSTDRYIFVQTYRHNDAP